MNQQAASWFAVTFPFLFVGMWLFVTTILAAMSGWFELQARYPDPREPQLLKLRGLSGGMGAQGGFFPKVGFRGALTLSACPSGLRVSMSRILGPFSRPFLVPWHEIRVESKTILFMPRAELRFGDPAVAAMSIDTFVWQRLAGSAGRPSEIPRSERVERSDFARMLLIQWLVITGLAATFFYVGSRALGGPGVPLAICVGFPALVFGIPVLIRYLRMR